MTKNSTRARDLTGYRFGRLTVSARNYDANNRSGVAYWDCRCDCGASHKAAAGHLIDGSVQSCGCLCRDRVSEAKTTHGMTKTTTYYTWAGIKQRCRNPKSRAFPDYGGRGIDVCDRWHDSFDAFLEDMGVKPQGSSIERIDNNLGYEPGNCRWTTAREQGRNKRNNLVLTVDGECHTLSEWAEITGIPKSTIFSRIERGWSHEDAVRGKQ